MGKFTGVLVLMGLMVMIASCARVEPGYVGIKVNLAGDNRGADKIPLDTGWVFYNPLTEVVYEFPEFTQTISWTQADTEGSPNDDSVTFNSEEGAIINADIVFMGKFIRERIPHIYVELRRDPHEIMWQYVRGHVRDSMNKVASTMKTTDIFGPKKQEFLDAVKKDLNKKIKNNFQVEMVSFIGALRVDPRVAASINATIEATQRAIEAENKVLQSKAEADQKIQEARGQAESLKLNAAAKAESILAVAKAQAEANKAVSASIDNRLIRWASVEKWDGVLPKITGETIPMITFPIDDEVK